MLSIQGEDFPESEVYISFFVVSVRGGYTLVTAFGRLISSYPRD
jgi:hypothetical protein